MKKFVASLLLLLASFPCGLAAVGIDDLSSQTALGSDVRYVVGDDPGYADPGFDDSGWKVTSAPQKLPVGAPSGFLWTRTRISADPKLKGRDIALLMGRSELAFEVYYNGSLVGTRGTMPPAWAIHSGFPAQYLIPSGLIGYGGEDVLAIRYWSNGPVLNLKPVVVADRAAFDREAGVVTFVSSDLNLAIAFVCAFIALYCGMLFFTRKREPTNLLFALASLFWGIYFYDFGRGPAILPYPMARALAQSGLFLGVAFITHFFIAFFGLSRMRKAACLSYAVALASTVAFFLGRNNSVTMGTVFNVSLLYMVAIFVFLVVIVVRELGHRNREALPLLAGMVVGIGCGTYDVVYQMGGREPFVWLQGYGIFALDLSMFVSLALRNNRAVDAIEDYSREVERKTVALSDHVGHVREVSVSVAGIGSELDGSIGSVAGSVESLAASSSTINASMSRQAEVVSRTSGTVNGLLDSLTTIYSGLEAQSRDITETTATITQMFRNIEEITGNLETTAQSAESLGDHTAKGKQAVLVLDEAINRVAEVSRNIYGIVDAVNEFAEQTNLLAMNAAIEAAHSGAAGKGFAVIAGEIKKLAAGSAEKSDQIRSSVGDILEKIDHGVKASAQVKETLLDIAGNTETAVGRIRSSYTAILEQRTASEQIQRSMSALSAASASIRTETDRQKAGSAELRAAMEDLLACSQDVLGNIAAISKENEEIVRRVREMKRISEDSRSAGANLAALLETGKDGV